MYSIKKCVVAFKHGPVCARKATREHSKCHTISSLSCILVGSYVVYSCTRQILSHTGLQELSISPSLYIFPFLITVIASLFHCLLVKRKIRSTQFPPFNWTMYHCMLLRNEVCTDCMSMDILPKCCHVHDW